MKPYETLCTNMNPQTHKEVLYKIGRLREISEFLGIDIRAVRKWAGRNNIPSQHWNAVVRMAKTRRAGISLQTLADIAEEGWEEREGRKPK